MKKRLLCCVMILVILMSLTLVGCSKTETETAAANTESAGESAGEVADESAGEAADESTAEKISVKFRMLTDEKVSTPAGSLIEAFAKEVNEKSDGQIEIEVYYEGQLYKNDQYYEAFATGSIDLAYAQFGKGWPKIIPEMTILSSAVFTDEDHALNALNGELGEYLGALLETKGKVKVLGWSGAGCVDCMLNTAHEITKPEDLEGLKLRVPNAGQMAQVEAFGGAGVPMSATDMYMAVQQGTVDGVYSTSPGGGMTVKLAEIVPYFTRVAVTGTAVEHGIVMNINSFNNLPADLQQLMIELSTTYGKQILDDTKAAGDGAWDVIRDLGAEVYVVPEDEVASWRAVWEPVRDQVLKEVLEQDVIDEMLAMVEAAK